RNTGYDEISLLSLSTSDYPYFEELVKRMHETFAPLGVNVSLPSLRINNQLRSVPKLMAGARKSGLTLAPEVARDDMREQIRKKEKDRARARGLPGGFQDGVAEGETFLQARPPRGAPGGPRRHRGQGRAARRHQQESDGPLQGRDGVGVDLRPQPAHAVS